MILRIIFGPISNMYIHNRRLIRTFLSQDSWVISGSRVTTERIVKFDTWFKLFGAFRKKWAPVTLAKMAAEFWRGQNPKWPYWKCKVKRNGHRNLCNTLFATKCGMVSPSMASFWHFGESEHQNSRWPPAAILSQVASVDCLNKHIVSCHVLSKHLACQGIQIWWLNRIAVCLCCCLYSSLPDWCNSPHWELNRSILWETSKYQINVHSKGGLLQQSINLSVFCSVENHVKKMIRLPIWLCKDRMLYIHTKALMWQGRGRFGDMVSKVSWWDSQKCLCTC